MVDLVNPRGSAGVDTVQYIDHFLSDRLAGEQVYGEVGGPGL